MDVILWWGFYLLTFYAFLPGFISRMFGFRVFSKGVAEREIALTFDDGPHPVYTPMLLDLLKAHGARVTFFVVGAHAEKYPDIVRRMHDEGHDIGIHNYVHRSNWIMGPISVRRHVIRTGDIIERITGVRPKYYRPPWGIVNVFDFVGRGKPQIVLWTALFGDWKRKVGADRLYANIKSKLIPGAVLLLHDCGDTFGADPDAPLNTIEAVGRVLEDAKGAGLRFVGVGELMALTAESKQSRQAVREGRGLERAPGAGMETAAAVAVGKGPVGATAEAAGSSQAGDGVAAGNAEKSSTGAGATMAGNGSDRGAANAGAGAASATVRQGPFKRLLVAAWMLWEDVFGWLFRLRPIGDGRSFHYRIISYGGPELELSEGRRLRRGDRVIELHFVNKMMLDIGMNSKSELQIAIRLIQLVKKSLPLIAEELRGLADGDKIVALYGVSMINRGSEGLGFETFALKKGLFAWLTNHYLRMLTAIIHPQGRSRVKTHGDRMEARMLVMPRQRLLAWGEAAEGRGRADAPRSEIRAGMATVGAAAGYREREDGPDAETQAGEPT